MTREFTPANPPKSGNARKLWDWWVEQAKKPPARLTVCRPGHWQRSSGACSYFIQDKRGRTYLVWSVAETIKLKLSDAWMAGGDYHLA